ncbi:HAD family phosphatase [Clostridioides difficile]
MIYLFFVVQKYNLGDDYLNNIKAAIFDLDGTLIDSMWVWQQIDIDYLSKRGHAVPNNLNDEITHLSFTQTAEYFKNRFSIEDSVEEIMNTWNTMAFNHYKNNVKLKIGALEYLHKLKRSGIKIGLATSNSMPLLTATLKNNNAFDLFDAITVTDEVKKSKSNPDIYLLAAKKLGVDPKDCMVFEDIIAAVEGAKLAGMKVTGVYDEHSKHQIDVLKKECDNYIYSYEELL